MPKDPWTYYRLCQRQFPKKFTCVIPNDLQDWAINDWAEELGLGIVDAGFDWLWVREWDRTQVIERPVYLNDELEQRIESYQALRLQHPEYFAPSEQVPIVTDRHEMLRFTERTGKPVGLVYDNAPYYQVAADLIGGDHPKTYARVLYPNRQGNGTVIIPRLLRQGQPPLFGLLHIFRHPIRKLSGGEFPRGFLPEGVTPAENAARELWEEFGIPPHRIASLTLLGRSRPDTGILGSGEVLFYLADITGEPQNATQHHEGIIDSEWLTLDALLLRVRSGEVLDGMTQTALLLYQLHNQ